MLKLLNNYRKVSELHVLIICGMGMIEKSNKNKDDSTYNSENKDKISNEKHLNNITEQKIDRLILDMDEKTKVEQNKIQDNFNNNHFNLNEEDKFHEIPEKKFESNENSLKKIQTDEFLDIKRSDLDQSNKNEKFEISNKTEGKEPSPDKKKLPKITFGGRIKLRSKDEIQEIKSRNKNKYIKSPKKKIKFKVNNDKQFIDFTKNKTDKKIVETKIEDTRYTNEKEIKNGIISDKKTIQEKSILDEDIRKVLAITDELLGNLPENIIDEFVKSENFALYNKVINKYKIK